MEKINSMLVATGMWGDAHSWEIHSSSETPPAELVTAVACVALFGNDIVLTRNQRGWEVLAGHIEPDETPLEALRREAEEEGGYVVEKATPIGYRKVTALKPPAPNSRESAYPYPTSYISYFLAETDSPISDPTGVEIIESRTFSLTEIQNLADAGEFSEIDLAIVRLGLQSIEPTK